MSFTTEFMKQQKKPRRTLKPNSICRAFFVMPGAGCRSKDWYKAFASAEQPCATSRTLGRHRQACKL